MPINCNGVRIIPDLGLVYIATFNQDGYETKPYIYISKYAFEIVE